MSGWVRSVLAAKGGSLQYYAAGFSAMGDGCVIIPCFLQQITSQDSLKHLYLTGADTLCPFE